MKDESSCKESQKDLSRLYKSSYQREMKFNVTECGRSVKRPDSDYQLGSNSMQVWDQERDLGVVIISKPSPEDHIEKKIRNVYNLLANMRAAICVFVD